MTPAPSPAAPRRRIKLIIEYDGSRYHGWQAQPNGVSVQQVLEEALARLGGGTAARVRGAGRTDAGVHARGQVAVFDTDRALPPGQFARALNSRLPSDVAVRHAEEVADDFDPRRDCVRKQYSYTIVAGPLRPALEAGRVWHVVWRLDPAPMQEAARRFEGRRSFHAFCRRDPGRNPDMFRAVDRCQLLAAPLPPPVGVAPATVADSADSNAARDANPGWRLRLEIEGRSFLYNMVRAITATLVEVGRGRLTLDELEEWFDPAAPARAPFCAPPQGLCLEWIRYCSLGT